MAFRPIIILFTSVMLFAVRMMFRISTKAICAKRSVGRIGPRKLIFISVCFLIVIVIEYLEAGIAHIEIVV